MSPNQHQPALLAKDVTVSYHNSPQPVLDKVNLELQSGELLAVLGPSGCGKTTFLKAVAGLLPTASGTIELAGRVVVDADTWLPPERRRVGLVPQDAALFPHLSVADNVKFGLKRHPDFRTKQQQRQRVEDLLELVGVSSLAKRKPAELSGGQAQRVAVARALAPQPALVLLDEPFAALDAALRARLRTDVAAILRQAGASAVLVTHDQDEALSMADRIAVFSEGRVVQCDRPNAVYAKPATAWVAEFLGTCTINEAGQVLRPEQVRLEAADDGARDASATADDAHATTHATVTEVEFLGHSTLYQVAVESGPWAGHTIGVRELGAIRFHPGQKVQALIPEQLHQLK